MKHSNYHGCVGWRLTKSELEKSIIDLCRQDGLSGIKYTEEEIQSFINDKHPFIARLISGSMKGVEVGKLE